MKTIKYQGHLSIRDLLRSITENSDDYDKKYMKIKLNSGDELPLNKKIKIPSMIIVARAFIHKMNKYYPQAFLDDYRLKRNKNIICETKSVYILLALLIDVIIYCYLINIK